MKFSLTVAALLLPASMMMCFFYANTYKEVPREFEKVKVTGGFISGTLNPSGNIHVFKGIPFAAPPVGSLRWKAPQPVIPWEGVKNCDKFGASPMQGSPAPFSMWTEEFLIPKEPISEDCLYLNVWTGAQSPAEKRAVLVWIYGGGFSSGGSAVPIYDGAALARKGIVLVSINYRVGLFGFFAHPDLTRESGNNASGNYGLMDQVAALQWIHDNIAAFGGDPGNVTIAGQSAGSMSVNCLVASPLAKGLFQKAIGESGASFTNGNAVLKDAEKKGVDLMQQLQVSSLEALRAVPAEVLVKKSQPFGGPIIDGYVLPAPIGTIFDQGKENKISLLTGWNQDEGFLFGPVKKADAFKKQAATDYAADSTTFLSYYPATDDSIAALSQLLLSRDQIFGVQNYAWANKTSDHGSNVFVYRFTRKLPATGEYVKYGAFHTGEVPYAFDNLQFVNRPWQRVDHVLADIISSYWANFAKTGNPNASNLPAWPGYTAAHPMIMLLGEKPLAASLPDKAALDFIYKKAQQ